MKKKHLMLIAVVAVAVSACKKSDQNVQGIGGVISVTNTIIGAGTLSLMSDQNIISNTNTIGANGSNLMPIASGSRRLNIGIPAVAATATIAAVAGVNYYTQQLTVTDQSNFSLFLTGTSVSAVDAVLINETYPRAYKDSICGVRFINLSPGSPAVSVNLQGSANGSEVASLAYKAYSNFVQHPAKAVNNAYTFEFRDAGTGGLIKSYTLSTPYLRNVTLCLNGIVGGTPAPGVTLTRNY